MNPKPIAITLIVLLALNVALFAFGKISQLLFWLIIVLTAILAYKVVPNLNK